MLTNLSIDESSDIYLGLGGSTHDVSACILKDGKIELAVESERVSRIKHSMDAFSPLDTAIKYLFESGDHKVKKIVSSDILNTYNWLDGSRLINYYNHHLCHAASTFYTSPFEKATIFVCDGIGSFNRTEAGYEFETYSYYEAKDTEIKLLGKNIGVVGDTLSEVDNHHVNVPNSLGLFYIFITKIIGFKFLQDGKTMGLSAYGTPKYYDELKSFFTFEGDGIIKVNFGEKESQEFYSKHSYQVTEEKKFQLNADIASSAQKVFEEAYFYCLNHLYKITKNDNLCLSGGVALNSVANGKITEKTPFKHIFTFPQCGDAGIAIGSAYLAYYEDGYKRVYIKEQSPFLGKEYSDSQIMQALKEKDVKYKKVKNVYSKAAKNIADGKIVGWFQGRSEVGPRALGHRSIVVDPRRKEMKDYLNDRVKKREFFRPFAPAVLEEDTKDYFEPNYRTPYMTDVFRIKEDKRSVIPSVVHVDGTGRLQTVGKDNEAFFNLITEFNKITGVPVILNTSFNINKMPIVETPEDAIDCYLMTNIDILYINDFECIKS